MKISLATPFLYQNRTTGSPSTTTLSCTQLCRLLCPPSSSSSLSLVNAATLVLGFDSISQSYDINGWKEAGTVDVLREACSEWYYEAVVVERGDDDDKMMPSSSRIEGPISTRVLSKLYHQQQNPQLPADDTSNNNCSSMAVVAGTTRVYRNEQEGWKQIDQLENLQLAMEAFRETIMPPLWSEQHRENHDVTTDQQEVVSTEENRKNNNVTDELEAFLSSTDHLAPHAHAASTTTKGNSYNIDDDHDQEEYESDGGTRYIRDCQSGNWIHEALMKKNTVDSSAGAGAIANGADNQSIHRAAAAAVQKVQSSLNDTTTAAATAAAAASGTKNKRKRKKPKFSAKSARNWIYVTGLPLDTTEEELVQYFSKVGIIDIDPESLKPKIKLYRHKTTTTSSTTTTTTTTTDTTIKDNGGEQLLLGKLKGDASICYARPESVELALQILDENLFRDGAILSVQRAKFEQHGSTFDNDNNNNKSSSSFGGGGKEGGKRRRVISESKRRVARLAAIQAVGWDESENGRIAGGLKGLRIIVLMNMFHPRELECDDNSDDDDDDTRLRALEREVHTQCEEIGTVEKITIFSKHPAGVVIVKFVKPNDASDAVKALNGKILRGNGRKVEASFWDGTTDYTVVDVEKEEKEAEKRLDKFGDWLEEQELPEEFQLRVEGGD